MKKQRIWAVILACLLIFTISIPAMADEGDEGDGSYFDVGPSGDDPAPDDPPPVDEDPPPAEDPPSSDDPSSSDPGGDDPSSSEPGPDDPSSSEPDPDDPSSDPDPDADPTIGPSGDDPNDEPWTPPDDNDYNDPGTTGGDVGGTSSTPARVPGGTGGTIQQPSFSPSAATPSPTPIPTPIPSSGEPNYKTFAKLTQKNNSMSVVLFYGGAGFVGVGSLGLITLLIFIVRGRRDSDDRDGIFEEIHEAENRQPARIPAGRTPSSRNRSAGPSQPEYEPDPAYGQEYTPGYEERPPVLHRPDPEALSVPVNGSMYTEEFELPPQPVRQTPPPAAAMYTEEFDLPEEMAQPPAPAPRQAPAHPMPQRPAPQPPVSGDTQQYDTTELLREILHGDSDK